MLKKAKSVFLNNSFQEKNFSKPIDSLLSLRLTTDEFLKTLAHIRFQTNKEFSTLNRSYLFSKPKRTCF